MFLGIQIIGVLFCVGMLYATYVSYRKKNYGYRSLLIWFAVWIAGIIFISFPSTVYGLMQVLEVERTADVFLVGSIAFILAITFYLYIVVKKNDQRMEELVRKTAMQKKKK